MSVYEDLRDAFGRASERISEIDKEISDLAIERAQLEKLLWRSKAQERLARKSTSRKIIGCLKESGEALTIRQIADSISVPVMPSLYTSLGRLARKGLVLRVRQGVYRALPEPEPKQESEGT